MTNDERTTWRCPYCNQFATLDHNKDVYASERDLFDDTDEGHVALMLWGVRCPNHECLKLSLNAGLWTAKGHYQNLELNELVQSWNLRPQSSAKPQPEYIPEPLREDYNEACLILDLIPTIRTPMALIDMIFQGMIDELFQASQHRVAIDIVVGLEYPVGKPVIAHELLVFEGCSQSALTWKRHQPHVWMVDLEEALPVVCHPARSMNEYSVSAWCHQGRDFSKIAIAWPEDVAAGQDKGTDKAPGPDDARREHRPTSRWSPERRGSAPRSSPCAG